VVETKRPSNPHALARYGVEAPYVPAGLAGAGAISLGVGARYRARWLRWLGILLIAQAGLYLHTTLHGKRRVWRRELDQLALRGDEQLLDLGCGRGAVLIAAAEQLPNGRATGVDLWRSQDQTGNDPSVTRANARDAGVLDRIELHTADMIALPFPDNRFDVVTSAMALHNIPSVEGRYRALDEAMRVLRPGGELLVIDFWWHIDNYRRHLGSGHTRHLGPAYWYGGPWTAATSLHVTKA
jgi:cyclopropane fatty-acyl-phospholipid synthase-like methyltransferase